MSLVMSFGLKAQTQLEHSARVKSSPSRSQLWARFWYPDLVPRRCLHTVGKHILGPVSEYAFGSQIGAGSLTLEAAYTCRVLQLAPAVKLAVRVCSTMSLTTCSLACVFFFCHAGMRRAVNSLCTVARALRRVRVFLRAMII